MTILIKSLAAVLVVLAIGGIAMASNDSPWQKHQYVGGNSYQVTTGSGYYYFYFSVDDYVDWANYPYSSRFYARAFHRSASWPYTYTYYYQCGEANSVAEAVNRIPDDSSMIGPNKAWSFTFNAPACQGFSAATFTIQCDANETFHRSRSGGYKETRGDGSKLFYSEEEERVYSEQNPSTNDYSCTGTFANDDISLVDETASGNARDERRREK